MFLVDVEHVANTEVIVAPVHSIGIALLRTDVIGEETLPVGPQPGPCHTATGEEFVISAHATTR